jgi:hypothetical protein
MKRVVLCVIVAAIVIGLALYRLWPRSHLDVTPDAQRQIEKPKRR